MNTEPKKYVVYWTSMTASKRRHVSDKYRANMKTFNDLAKAQIFQEKLETLNRHGGVHQQRHIFHVSYVYAAF